MEAVHAELVRLATELEVVKSQVQTECNALRDLFANCLSDDEPTVQSLSESPRSWKTPPAAIRWKSFGLRRLRILDGRLCSGLVV